MVDISIDTSKACRPAVEANVTIDCRGETCPVPLVEARKAFRKAQPGDVVEIRGSHPASKREIPMAVEALGLELICVEGSDTDWAVRVRR